MVESKASKLNIFDYITDRAATFCLGAAIRYIVIGCCDKNDKINNLANAACYLGICIEKEVEYVMCDTENCEHSAVEFVSDLGLSINLGCALIEIDNALNYGMNGETGKVIERLKKALTLVDNELKGLIVKKGE